MLLNTLTIVFIVAATGAAGAAGPGYDRDSLEAEQAALADEMLRFIDEMEGKHYALVAKLNGNRDYEAKSFEGENSDYGIRVSRVEEDLDHIRAKVDLVFETHAVGATGYRKAICSGHRKDLLWPGCAAVSFCAPPFLNISPDKLALVKQTFAALFDAYADALEKRADEAYSERDLIEQDALRRRWLEGQMIHDPYAQHGTPQKVRSYANYPPTVTYQIQTFAKETQYAPKPAWRIHHRL